MAGVTELECNGSVTPKQLVIDSKRPILQNIILRSMFGLVFLPLLTLPSQIPRMNLHILFLSWRQKRERLSLAISFVV